MYSKWTFPCNNKLKVKIMRIVIGPVRSDVLVIISEGFVSTFMGSRLSFFIASKSIPNASRNGGSSGRPLNKAFFMLISPV